ncbi:MAG: glycogen phosphorylase [Deltaproteobacteria bacterium HGW-Deltaproteobacteria-14]|jgi:starch phosphorylase|nr:MAG: glycogen phosphorylase [Deltaproteobacteria bacterium HGW-Deltaproteobacteria-14]
MPKNTKVPASPAAAADPSVPAANAVIRVEDDRTGMSPEALERAVLDHLYYTCSKTQRSATPLDIFNAMAHAVRDRLTHRWLATKRSYTQKDTKRLYYLSAEFLMGRLLERNLVYLGIDGIARALLAKYAIDLDAVIGSEVDPGLGNGGLGRLAACFLDSMACHELPGYGYGIRYEFGIFHQVIHDGWQVEQGDAWLRYGCPWELPRHEYTVEVNFGGRVVEGNDAEGRYRARWVDTRKVLGVPYDIPCPGYDNNTVNTLRLWSARASREFDLEVFNDGDYRRAVEEKAMSESISKVLYPKDETPQGKELRLRQQYFFVCCSIHDIVRRYKKYHRTFAAFPDKVAIQLNDTHPSVTIAELMRVFIDDEQLSWEEAWDLTHRTVGYTNHTLLVEALERWPVEMFGRLLPRHLAIIFEINARFLSQVARRWPGDDDRINRMSLIEEGPLKQVRMAHLAVVGSHSVNGVAALHSDLVRTELLPDFAELWPERFNNKTNGVTPRRWLMLCNPPLAKLITRVAGPGWVNDFSKVIALEAHADDPAMHAELAAIKLANKQKLVEIIARTCNVRVPAESLFDVQVKRIHQYKRQLMNCLYVISRFQAIKADPDGDHVPRVFIFGGKAAPGYAMAKLHIKLINAVAEVVNHDPVVGDRLKVVFIPNYNVSLAERIIPAADISEQISLAGKEASGTGNMKFAMNGALTLGTYDGANIEIRAHVGAENFFLFGLRAEEVTAVRARGYTPHDAIRRTPRLKRAFDLVRSGFFSPDDHHRFSPVLGNLENADPYLVCADFDAYCKAQDEVDEAWRDPHGWQRRVAHNIANMGYFSSDRTIDEYSREIWGLEPCPVELQDDENA